MKKVIGVLLIILIVVGIALFLLAFSSAGFDFSKMFSGNTETNTYSVAEEFQKIDIVTQETDVIFKPSDLEGVRIVCVERAKRKHNVTVEEGTLKVSVKDERKWYERFSFFSGELSMTVFIPSAAYDSLKIENSTGDVSIPDAFSFGDVTITVSTGDVDLKASSVGACKIAASTGDVILKGIHAEKTEVSVSTGDVTAESVTCAGDFAVNVTTGKTTATDVLCRNFISQGSTGKLIMKDVVATETFSIERSTGDVRFEKCDAGEITVEASTGDVSGSLRTEKIFVTKTSTGSISVPESVSGGKCKITTTTGDIEISISE